MGTCYNGYIFMNKPKVKRNSNIVLKRKANPKKWTFRALGKFFKLDEKTVYEIWKRDQDKYSWG